MFTYHSRFRRMLALTTAFTMLVPAIPAFAQDATDSSTAAPPTRVGEIASVNGSVSFNGAGSNGQWVAATGNYPLTTGDSVFTQSGAQATLAIDSSRLTLSDSTELQVTGIDQNSVAATESQGEMFLSINYLQSGQSYVISTPRGTVTINQNGNYDIAAGDQTNPTVITVLAGEATVTDPGATLQVQANQAGVLTGTDQTTAQMADAQHDPFITAMLAQIAPPPPSYAPPVVQQMTGVSELGNYGSWDQSPQYGAVWYPQVDASWTPYREGHWAFVAPWGYTWVDSEPWGFAPFHYGRWVDDGNRWGWAPAPAYGDGGGYGGGYQPVYAPAVVSFFGGIGGGIGIGLTIGALNSGDVGWVPLGPDEPYYPYYRSSPDYIRNINRVNIRNINNVNIHNTTIINNYNYGALKNRRGATYVPGDALSRGEPVGRYGKPVSDKMFADARPVGPEGFHPAQGAGDHGAFALPPPQQQHRAAQAPQLAAFAQRRTLPPATISHERANLQPNRAGFAEPNAPGLHPNALAPNGAHPPTFGGQPALRPGQPELHPGQPALAHPGFATMPGFHPPPPPPTAGQHAVQPMGAGEPGFHPGEAGHVAAPGQPFHPQAPGQGFHPGATPQPPQAFHPQTPQAFHPQAPQAFHPQASTPYHPQELPHVVRPTTPEYHPPAPAYHPPAPAYHPPVQAYHPPAPAYHPPVQQFHPQPQARPQPQPQPRPEQRPQGGLPKHPN